MNRNTTSENGDLTSPRSSRAASFSSEKTSMSSAVMMATPASVYPPPAYVAVAAASQIVTDQHNAVLREQLALHQASSPIEDVALFSDGALTLVNSFLDNILLTFLAIARASTLSALRPAIVDVLKSKLAREAIESADQELQDLLAGEPEDDQVDESEGDGSDGVLKWDLVKVWKRARLRVMVYTRLGEMEEEDEETYIAELEKQDGESSARQPASTQGGIVSWAAAIFLTSVIEHVAEQALNICGQAAFARAAGRRRKSVQSSTTDGESESRTAERVVIEEHDAEKIALSPTLGRLWRTWRKRARGSTGPTSPYGRKTVAGRFANSLYHQPSFDESVLSNEDGSRMSMDKEVGPIPTETEIAANIPLPMTERDVDEIEVPGLAKQFDEDESDGTRTPGAPISQRPHSVIFLTSPRDLQHALSTWQRRPLSLPPPPTRTFEGFEEAEQAIPAEDAPVSFETPKEAEHEEEAYFSNAGPQATSDNTPIRSSAADSDSDNQTQRFAQEGSNDNLQEEAVVPNQAAHAAVASRRSSRYSSRSTTAGIVDQYARDSRSSMYNDEYDSRAIGVARTSNVPITTAPRAEEKLTANISGTDLVDMPNVEYYLEKNDRPESAYLASAPLAVSKSPVDVSPLSEHAPHGSSRNVVSSVSEAPVAQTPRESAAAGKSPVSPIDQKAHALKIDSHAGDVAKKNSHSSDEPERATVQRISSNSPTASVSSSILQNHRTSDSSMHHAKGFSRRLSEDDRRKDFDDLVNREEPVKYTLTPHSVRDDHTSTSAISKEESLPVAKVTVHSRQKQPSSFSSPSAPTTSAKPTPAPIPGTSRQSQPTAARPSATNTKRWGPIAREPRVQTETMRDFADFIRSTGPNREAEVPQPILAATSSPGKSSIGRRLSSRSRSSTSGSKAPAPPVSEGPTARPRKHLEPRSPVSPNNESGELINFIRQGPPSNKSGEHRIARTVAPFRSTMDSDEFTNLYSEHATPPESVMSTASVATTDNSRTGLLPSSGKMNQPTPQQSASGPTRGAVIPPPDASGPTRTRRRVKDPYAIDLSEDDEEDLLTSLPHGARPKKRQEESLIDFLKNVEPPSGNDPAPLIPSGSSRYTNGWSSGPRQAPAVGPRVSGMDTYGGSRKTDTSDLADFLRSSGPPEMPAAAASRPGTSTSKSSQKSAWQFWRKKSAA